MAAPDEPDLTSDTGTPSEVDRNTELPAGVDVKGDFLRVAKRDLREDELDSPAARRFMLADIDRLAAECAEHRREIKRLHELDKDCAVLRVEYSALQRSNRIGTIIFGLSSVGAGAAPSYIEVSPVGWVFLILFLMGMVASGFGKMAK